MKRFALFLAAVVLLLAGCGRTRTATTPTVTPLPTPTAHPLDWHATALLTAPQFAIQCDHGEGATITCVDQEGSQQIEVTTNASVYARWAMRATTPIATPLTGLETLHLALTSQGNLAPNLYLVEDDGDRIPVQLQRRGFGPGTRDIYIPLPEIADDDGNRPDFSAVNEIQIVFEWADMAGTLTVDEISFLPVWDEAVAPAPASQELAEALVAPDGFVLDAVADGLSGVTQIAFTDQGDMLVSMQNGRIWWYHNDGAGTYPRRHLYAAGFTEIVGLLYDPVDGAVWAGGRGQLFRTLDTDDDGVADLTELRIDGLPWGRHQNNGLVWNPDPDPFSGEAGNAWIYFGLGSTGDLEDGSPINSTILRFPRTGQSSDELEIVSRGNRNPYMVVWADLPVDLAAPDGDTTWQLFASENGPDFNDAPDEVNHIRWGHDYGFPDQFGPVEEGAVDGEPYSGPVYPALAHTSASGLAYVNNPDWPPAYRTLYVSLFGQVFSEGIVGHIVEGVTLRTKETNSGTTYRGEPFDFITGLDRPLPLMTDPNGNLLVGDYATGIIYRVRYAGS